MFPALLSQLDLAPQGGRNIWKDALPWAGKCRGGRQGLRRRLPHGAAGKLPWPLVRSRYLFFFLRRGKSRPSHVAVNMLQLCNHAQLLGRGARRPAHVPRSLPGARGRETRKRQAGHSKRETQPPPSPTTAPSPFQALAGKLSKKPVVHADAVKDDKVLLWRPS